MHVCVCALTHSLTHADSLTLSHAHMHSHLQAVLDETAVAYLLDVAGEVMAPGRVEKIATVMDKAFGSRGKVCTSACVVVCGGEGGSGKVRMVQGS